MADRIHVVPAHLRQAAVHHEQTSDYLRTVPSSHAAIQESLDSLGPIFGELRDAGRELLELRRRYYEQQADDHFDLADNLKTSATMWEEHEQEAARNLGSIIDDGR
ncbi:ESX-1 secretion-associated protein [Mycobacterium spongiae]|uniref:ESX-1 secretion-associated protein n=1 Tax=Mycobacterium spongiae TaxID=886343 RepID=A0A975JU16_9MYCO|nr:ESX-1 secretion-associated protein [Mycobacterium spongiae]QUR65700.1 ESX-1 secretion-associated protein [Mycobacterium spongiae]